MKKNLLFLIESMIVGGAERVLIDLANNLDPKKYDITVISIFKETVYKDYNSSFSEMLKPHIHKNYLIDNTSKWKYKLFNYSFNHCPKKWFHYLLIGRKYDVEIAFYEGFPTVFLAHSSNPHSKKVAWLHYGNGFQNLSASKKKETIDVYSHFDQIIGVSLGVCKNFQNRVCNNFPIEVKYNIIDEINIIKKSNKFIVERESNRPLFISVGRLTPVKGFDRLLKVCHNLIKQNYQFNLWIIGEGTERINLEKLIIDYHLEKNVSLLGNQQNPFPYVKIADWYICSSYAEGFSTSMTEATILGIPIISTLCAGTKELLGNDEYGLVVENSEDGIFNGMSNVLNNKYLREKYQEQLTALKNKFKKDVLLKEIEKIL